MYTNRNQRSMLPGLAVLLIAFTAMPAYGQIDPILQEQVLYEYESEIYSNTDGSELRRITSTISYEQVPWLRVHFTECELGDNSTLTLKSTLDGGLQRLTARSVLEWQGYSAAFNGSTIEVTLNVAPGDENVYYRVDELIVGDWRSDKDKDHRARQALAICGTDDRVSSTDPRVARISVGCTAWLISNGAILTAGHCVDADPDGSGPLLPDGNIDILFSTGFIEFNVPSSFPNGTIVRSNPDDQFVIAPGSIQYHFDGNGQGLGKDWAVFACLPNNAGGTNDGLLPVEAQQSFFRVAQLTLFPGIPITVTGYGIDSIPAGTSGNRNADNQTQQTGTGPYEGLHGVLADYWHEYSVDTEGGNSGSPIEFAASGCAIGIHTNGGCSGSSGNNGTAFAHPLLAGVINDFLGANAAYVDKSSCTSASSGTVFKPFSTIAFGKIAAEVWGGPLCIVKGAYNETLTFDQPLTILAPVGRVVVGE